ncbi:hypothetical protein [Brachybacterium fresconis]|uniref:Asparagine synthetase domain-containing protein n=1 Tax=Brachybacterium fresconis TaxID=173363 RepID=A0ABS4YKM6_9MICO|nr:hypothetical protein [Brachybacterium fresconis]MBP2409040.1 hypothetical protein [Brachybacterium fresconis]
MNMLEYRLGFILTSRRHQLDNQSFLHRWNRLLTPGFKLFVHPESSIHRVEGTDGHTIVAIGDIFVAHGGETLDTLLARLASGERAPLDSLAGRFAIFILRGRDGAVVHDPLGSQAVFYRLGPSPIVASHSSLIADCDSLSPSPDIKRFMASDEYRSKVTRFLPGDLSAYSEIVHLIPNNELDLRSGATSRYWPREAIRASSFEDLIEVWDEYFAAYAKFLSGRYNPVIGLTGGVDSRAIIATLHSLGVRAKYITWDKMPAEEAARIPVLADYLGGEHEWVHMSMRPSTPEANEIREAARNATGLTRGTPLLPAQIAPLLEKRSLFVKGLGGEVMRGPFNSRVKAHLPQEPESLAYALYAGEVRKTASKAYEVATRSAIRSYLARGNYDTNLFDADFGDLVYWEQRMGTWTAVQHAEFSVVLASHSAMNSRKLFAAAWGLPDDERLESGLIERIIAYYDPTFAAM